MFGKFFIYDGMDYGAVVLLEMKQIRNLMMKFGIEFTQDEMFSNRYF